MRCIVIYLILCVTVSPGSIIIVNGQELMIDIKVLPESGDDGQCASMEERESKT